MSADSTVRVAITIKGVVQGVGFRPFVYKLARRFALVGFVRNSGEGVYAELEGAQHAIDACVQALQTDTPPLARIDALALQSITLKQEQTFEIKASQHSDAVVMISPDIAMCDACEQELLDPENRRFHYPFINCTHCGPRYSILNALPYDRQQTSMQAFAMCPSCETEYTHVENRRYHAQPISCFECGPTLTSYPASQDIIHDGATTLQQGGVVALQGIGGFHLIANALDANAVAKVRHLKHRLKKPLAVMCKDGEHAKAFAHLSPMEIKCMQSLQRPIVIAQKRSNTVLAQNVAPDIDAIGLFLPYSPLHLLLLQAVDFPVVATSANVSGMPITTSYETLIQHFDASALFIIAHNREIVNACDDSVLSVVNEKSVMLRLSRGYAPLNILLNSQPKTGILAVGANQKSAIALSVDGHAILSPYIGDLNTVASVALFEKSIETFLRFYNLHPTTIVHDKHPEYVSTKWAQRHAQNHQTCAIQSVAHHYAHALSVMAEHQLDSEALAFCFDGTGYGDDGTLWGAEVLRVSPTQYERVAHYKSLALIGGEQAIKEPIRQLAALLFTRYTPNEIIAMRLACMQRVQAQTLENWYTLFTHNTRTIRVTSMGRLFDCVYALCGYGEPIAYEGQSGMIVESLAREVQTEETYAFHFENGVLDYMPMIEAMIDDQTLVTAQQRARKFMNTLVQSVMAIARHYATLPLLFCGGVFQNRLLLELMLKRCEQEQLTYYIPQRVPINDGGIAMGQLYYAIKQHERG